MAPSNSNETKELRINPPTHFTGNRDDLDNFIQDCTLYLTLNGAVYETDEKKIIFMLSYMTEGTARAWKEAFVRDIINSPINDFGSLKQFTVDLKKAFEASDSEGDARAKLRQLKQGKDSVDDYVAQFRILAGKARMTDNAALTEYFMEGVNTGILQKIFAQEKVPATITEWYERTSRCDSHYRRIQEILGRSRGTSGNAQTTNDMKKPFIPRFTPKEQDPNAMDVDRLSTNDRTEHVAKSRWFRRHEKENLARNPEEQKPNQKFEQNKKTAKIALAQIRNIVAGMDSEEKDEIYEDIFKEDSIVTMNTLRISSVIMTDSRMRPMHVSIPIVLKTIRGNETIETKVLLDTGAEGLFMDKNYAEEHDVVLQKLPNPIIPSNVDGTLNHAGEITHFTWIQAKIDRRILLEKLWSTDLGSLDVIFGFPWFKENNPQIVWKTGRVQLPKADLETTSLYLAKDGQRRKEIKEEEDEFRKELLQQSSSKQNRTRTGSTFLEKKKVRQSNYETRPRTPPAEEKRRLGQFSKTNTPQTERMIRFNEIETGTKTEPISPDWRQLRQNKGRSPMMGNPSKRRTEQIAKQSDEPNWRSRKWEKPIQEVESPSIAPKTEMSEKLEDNDEQNQRSRLKELITQRLEAQSIALATEQENERNLRTRLKKGIIQRTEPLSTAQIPFIKEMELDEEDEESETEEDYKRRRGFIHAYLTMDNDDEQVKQEETETDKGIVGTPEEQKRRLLHAYLTSTMEKEENEREEQNNRRELLHMYSKRTMDNDEVQTEQDETDTYLRTSMEEVQEPSTWEEYDKEEPLEGYDKDEPFEENDDEGKWTTQFSYPTEEEENALFLAFMTGTVKDQKKWINAKMNLARATTNEETRRREEEILHRIIPTEIVDLDRSFEEEDEEGTDNLSECRTNDHDMDQEEDSTDYQVDPFSPPEQEKSDEFIEEEDIQLSEPLKAFYREDKRQDEETVHSLSSTTELDNQLERAKHFTELDMRWKYDNERIADEDQWKENFETNQVLFEPMTILSCPYSPTISQTLMEEIFQDEQNKQRIIVNRDYDIQTKEEDTEDTRSAPRRSRNNNPFTEPEGCTPWVARTEHGGLLYSGNQPQIGPMKLNGIAEWPTPTTTTKEVKSFLGFRNFDKEFTQNEEDLTESKNKRKEKGQDNCDIIMLPERLFPDLLDQELDDEWTFRNNDEPNHFSKDTVATSVNNVIAVNVTTMDPQKWITMAQIVNNMINSLSGRGPNIWKDIFEDWRIWILQLPNKNTALTNHSILRHSKPIQILNGKQARQSLFLLEQPDQYMTENADNQNKILLPSKTTIKTVDEEAYRSIEDKNYEESPVQNVFDTPTKGMLLPWNLQTSWKRKDNLLFYIEAFSIPPGPLLLNQLKPLGVGTVVEDHGSTEGVISRIPKISEPYRGKTTTIPLGTLNKRYELSDKSTFDQRTHFVLHKYEQLPGLKLIAYTAHYPWKNGTAKHINSEIGKSFLPTLIYNTKSRTTRESTQQKLKQRMSKQEGLF